MKSETHASKCGRSVQCDGHDFCSGMSIGKPPTSTEREAKILRFVLAEFSQERNPRGFKEVWILDSLRLLIWNDKGVI